MMHGSLICTPIFLTKAGYRPLSSTRQGSWLGPRMCILRPCAYSVQVAATSLRPQVARTRGRVVPHRGRLVCVRRSSPKSDGESGYDENIQGKAHDLGLIHTNCHKSMASWRKWVIPVYTCLLPREGYWKRGRRGRAFRLVLPEGEGEGM